MAQPNRRSVLGLLAAAPLATAAPVTLPGTASAQRTLAARIEAVLGRAEFAGARWGLKFSPVDGGRPIYAHNPDQLFVPASAVKVFHGGTAFDTLGAARRLRTTVYRTGPVHGGTLHGDLVLVAGGDMLIGGRIRPDGTLALPEPDHSYGQFPGAGPAPGDPLRVLRDLARQVAGRGVRRVAGQVRVDISLFREGLEDIASGAPITVSPIMVNDNLVDVSVLPGEAPGAAATLRVSPDVGYVTVVNQVLTVAPGDPVRPLRYVDDTANPDGTRTVTLTGDVATGGFLAYAVPTPAVFAAMAFAQALRDKGVDATAGPAGTTELVGTRELARHRPPPLSEQVKVMLKVSSNVHTVMWPYVIGAVAGREPADPKAAYQRYLRALYRAAGLDPDAPGVAEGRYTPDFFVAFLAHLRTKPYFGEYRRAMPIMGVDGSLATIEPDSPAAGHVYAKTGTGIGRFTPGGPPTVYKALAGYLQLPDGRWTTFAQFMELAVPSLTAGHAVADRAALAMGEIATLVHQGS